MKIIPHYKLTVLIPTVSIKYKILSFLPLTITGYQCIAKTYIMSDSNDLFKFKARLAHSLQLFQENIYKI